jgi:hypothetical protein
MHKLNSVNVMKKEVDVLSNDRGKDITELVNRGNRGPYITYQKRIVEEKQRG